MNRLRQLVAVLLNPTDDPEQTHVALEAAGVPVSFADCRNCPNPCEDGKQKFGPIPFAYSIRTLYIQATKSIQMWSHLR